MPSRHLISTLILLFFLTTFSFLYIRLNSQILYLKATNRVQEGDYHTAVDHLEKAIQKQPNDPLIWKELGKAYHNLGSSKRGQVAFDFAKKSEHAYRQATLLNPLDAAAFYGLARETSKLEMLYFYLNPAEESVPYNALPFFKKAIHLRPNGILYHYALAFYLHQQNKKQELFQIVKNLVHIYPTVYGKLKKEAFWTPELNQAAKKGLYQAIDEDIAPWYAYTTLSSLLAQEKDWANAISLYQKALDFQPTGNTSGSSFHLGRLYLESGQLEEAEESFLKALSTSQTREKDLENLYRFYKAKDYSEELFRLYHRVGKSFTLSDRIDILLARSLIDQNRYDKARQILIDLNQKKPSAEAFYWLARIAEIEKDWNSMGLAIQKATVLDPRNSRYHLIFSQALQRINKLERAEKETGLAIKHSTKPSPNLFSHRAGIRWKRNDFAGAAKDWEAAIQLNPTRAHFYGRVAEAHMRLSNRSLAVDYYQKAINLNPKNKHFQKRYNELIATHQKE